MLVVVVDEVIVVVEAVDDVEGEVVEAMSGGRTNGTKEKKQSDHSNGPIRSIKQTSEIDKTDQRHQADQPQTKQPSYIFTNCTDQ